MLELGTKRMHRIAESVWVSKLASGLWLHTTTDTIDEAHNVYFPANGLVLELEDESILIDTGYLPEHAEALIAWSKNELSHPITNAVVTHFHRDRTGGIRALEQAGIPTLAHSLTIELARDRGAAVPNIRLEFSGDTVQLSEGCELYFPGAGHTPDNIVVWLSSQRVLFGGCFLKSSSSGDLGNLRDANVSDWMSSLQRVRARYPARKIIVPGHGTVHGDAVAQTLRLLRDVSNQAGKRGADARE
ncbi:MAG TPA: subclass B1 metallo-beta-lactamase [Steroidobacteraceae bacterium]|nr:subclass B1 metallo-beta-lactamase [Steroidobacteraceae bacterium]